MKLSRRKFILRNGLLVPLVSMVLPKIAFPQVLLQGRKDVRFPPASGGSSPLASFYDGILPGAGNGDRVLDGSLWWSQAIVAGETGQCTRLRAYVSSGAGSTGFKMGIYDNSGNLLGSGSGTVTSSGAYIYITLTVPVNVTNGTTYKLGINASNNNFAVKVLTGQTSGTSHYDVLDYSLCPPSTLTGANAYTESFAFGFGGNGTTP